MRARFRDRLQREFEERRAKNGRYSLRAFANSLGTDHSTLSQILRERRRTPIGRMRVWARELGLDPEETAAYIVAEHLVDAGDSARDAQMQHWTAEAMAVIVDRTHWEIYRLCGTGEFRSDSRWIAERVGTTVDQVNIVLTRLLRLRLLESNASGHWVKVDESQAGTERDFRRLALARVRQKAAEFHVLLPAEFNAR